MNIFRLIGFPAAILTTASFLPQAIQTIRTKKTHDLSLGTYAMMTSGTFLWLVYGISIGDWPLILANGISCLISGIILRMKLAHG